MDWQPLKTMMSYKVPSKPNHSGILWLMSRVKQWGRGGVCWDLGPQESGGISDFIIKFTLIAYMRQCQQEGEVSLLHCALYLCEGLVCFSKGTPKWCGCSCFHIDVYLLGSAHVKSVLPLLATSRIYFHFNFWSNDIVHCILSSNVDWSSPWKDVHLNCQESEWLTVGRSTFCVKALSSCCCKTYFTEYQ